MSTPNPALPKQNYRALTVVRFSDESIRNISSPLAFGGVDWRFGMAELAAPASPLDATAILLSPMNYPDRVRVYGQLNRNTVVATRNLFLTIGVAGWYASFSGDPYVSPPTLSSGAVLQTTLAGFFKYLVEGRDLPNTLPSVSTISDQSTRLRQVDTGATLRGFNLDVTDAILPLLRTTGYPSDNPSERIYPIIFACVWNTDDSVPTADWTSQLAVSVEYRAPVGIQQVFSFGHEDIALFLSPEYQYVIPTP
jgi:hypothetical protein